MNRIDETPITGHIMNGAGEPLDGWQMNKHLSPNRQRLFSYWLLTP
jgi:hypothetical protein